MRREARLGHGTGLMGLQAWGVWGGALKAQRGQPASLESQLS